VSVRVEFVENDRRWRAALPARTLARQAVAAALAECGVKLARGAEMCIHLVNDEEIRGVNKQWRDKDAPTNVLSFPAVDAAHVAESKLLGDVLIALETLEREAAEEGRSLTDHFRHLVVHGFLHLLGYDHIEDDEAEAMEALETRALQRLGVADPYADSELESAAT